MFAAEMINGPHDGHSLYVDHAVPQLFTNSQYLNVQEPTAVYKHCYVLKGEFPNALRYEYLGVIKAP
jgi:hypothetical protein